MIPFSLQQRFSFAYIYIHTYIHTYIHIYIYLYIYVCTKECLKVDVKISPRRGMRIKGELTIQSTFFQLPISRLYTVQLTASSYAKKEMRKMVIVMTYDYDY